MPDGNDRGMTLREQQLLFANHLRNPVLFPAPQGIEERRLQVYRELFFNNICQLLAGTFPVMHSILADADWQALVRDFYTMHRCETPLFPWIAGEFAAYIANERDAAHDPVFLVELAHYEWSEIALRHEARPAMQDTVVQRTGDKPVLSPLCWPLSYRFPVHRIGVGYLPQQAPEMPTCLLVYRNNDDVVKFVESNPATFHLLQLLDDAALPDVVAVVGRLAADMQHPDPAALSHRVSDTLAHLRSLGVLD